MTATLTRAPSALDGLRVIDATGPMGNYCGKMFADLGADVILVEPPQGADLRREPPFRQTDNGPGESLEFEYNNTNKRSVVLDLDRPDDVTAFRQLVAGSDLLLESWPPGELARLGLAPQQLLADHPNLVITSISPFGQTGPWADYAAADLICVALGGLLSLTGYPDGPPVVPFGQQSYVMASLYAAVSSMMALTHAELTGEGQWVDVSVHESVTTALETAPQYLDLEGIVRGRPQGMHRHAGSGIYPCLDGYVYLFVGGVASSRFWGRLAKWLIDAGIRDAEQLEEGQWEDVAFLGTESAKDIFAGIFTQLASSNTKSELYLQAQERGIPLCPVNTPADLAGSRQLAARGYFESIPAGPAAGVRMPGAPYQLGLTPWSLRHAAPTLGEHSAQLLAEVPAHTSQVTSA